MKRIVLIIAALLMGLATRAQSVTYTCRYWFDQNFAQAAMATFSSSNWQAELDVGSLADGLHTLHLHVMDTSMKWSAPQNYLFLKTTATPSENYVFHHWIDQGQMHSSALGNGQFLLDVATLDSGLHTLHVMLKGSEYTASQSYIFLKPELTGFDAENWVYHCWFDEDYAHRETDSLGNGNFLLDVSDLEEGLHTLNVVLQGNSLTATQSYMFMRVEMIETGSIDMSNLTYSCWFDQDYEQRMTDSLRDGNILLDVADLTDGLHTVNVMLQGGTGTLTSTRTYMFLKVAVEDPSVEQQYHCWFDQDLSTMQIGTLGGGIFQLEVNELSNGLHIVNVQLEKSTRTAPQSYFFYKIPFGGNGLNKWEYCVNGDWANRVTTNIVPSVDTLSIISLLPVPTQPIRSSCFHFHPNGDEPYLNAKNEITLRFWTADGHFMDRSAFYVDEQVMEPIEADDLERNTTVCIPAPRNNQMQWYKMPLVVGDSIAFRTDKACSLQLFAPSGVEVYAATASEALAFGGIHAWEDGDYYLVVHDVTGSGDEICLTNVYVHKYAILAYDVHLVGNGGCSTITFQGNGFNSLLDAYLVNYQNDTIHRLDIGHESNTTTTVTFNFYEENLGVYDAVFQFYGETIRINGALEVQEPVDIVLTSSVSYPSQFLRNTPCTYTFTITNNGNMSAYAVPIYVYLSTNTMDGVSLIDFDGLKLPSLIDGIDLDTLSPSRIEELREISDAIGDIHHFFIHKTIDEVTGDSIIARSNFFFLNIAPFETKTLTLKITANESLDVWMTIPNDIVSPLTLHPDRGDWFGSPWCCVKDNWTCLVNSICEVINIVNILSSFFPANPVQEISGIASCICGGISTCMSIFTYWKCEGNTSFGGMISDNINSITGTVASCAGALIPKEDLKKAKGIVESIFTSLVSAISGGVSVNESCFVEKKRTPGCPRGDSDGGPSDPVNSLDPNDIHGYLSESGSHYMRQEIQNVQYEIEFENDTTLATAAAHTIIVRDTLDATKFDLNSLAARSVTIGDKRLELSGEQTFARTLDMRPDIYVIAQIEQDYDPATGIIEWTIQSLDPITMEPTDDPNQGVLPVNYFGDGVGFIDYSVNLKETFADGTEINNRAGIIFDQEDVIMTPVWTNIVDAVKPTSQIESVATVEDSLTFHFVSSDNRSGVWYHALYYRNDSTYQEWQVRKAQVFENDFMLKLDDLQTTEYLVMAVDSAGNREDKLMNAEYVFSLDSIVYYTLTVTDPEGCGEVHGSGTYVAGSHVTIEAIPDDGCYFAQWNDGVTDNPRVVHLVQDTTFVAMFGYDQLPITQTTNFTTGWNWWSSYVELSDNSLQSLQDGLDTSGEMVKSQNDGYASYLDGYGWYGSLVSINNESTYQVRTNAACSVELMGSAANPEGHPITLNSGWNWVGYPMNASMGVEDALSGIAPQNGDMLKSQNNGFASYLDGFGWYGSLNTLNPGMGLMFNSNNSSAVTLVYPNGASRAELKANQTTDNNHWQPNLNAYADNMTVMAVVELDGNELLGENYELAAFANDEVRGSARLLYVEPLNRYMAFLTVAVDEACELRFRLYNAETGTVVETVCTPSLQYEANAIVGSFAEPYVVSFRNSTGTDEWASSLQVFPNPVERGQTISLGISAVETLRATSVQIINALGMVVETLHATSLHRITVPETAGVYTLRITVEGKGTCHRKLLVK